jgi:hypothetical protein
VRTIEFLYGGVELLTFETLDEQFGDLFTPFEILRAYLPHLSLLRRSTVLPPAPATTAVPLVGVHGSKGVFGELAFVLVEGGSSLVVPDLTFVVREVLPCESDDLGEGAVVRFDVRRDVLGFDEGGAEEDEGVWGSRDVVVWFFL